MDPKENLDKTIAELTAEEIVTDSPREEVATETVIARTEQPVAPASKPKQKGHGMAIGMVFFALLAIAGIAFGVWTWLDKDQQVKSLNDQITTLRSQNGDLEDQIIELQNQIQAVEKVDCIATPDAVGCEETNITPNTNDVPNATDAPDATDTTNTVVEPSVSE